VKNKAMNALDHSLDRLRNVLQNDINLKLSYSSLGKDQIEIKVLKDHQKVLANLFINIMAKMC